LKRISRIAAAFAMAAVLDSPPAMGAASKSPVCAACVKATMLKLAGDELRGRRCGTGDENAAARYLAASLQKLGVRGGLPDGGYLQPVELRDPTLAAPPTLELTAPGGETLRLTHGQEMIAIGAPAAAAGPVVRITEAEPPPESVKGKVVIYDPGQAKAAVGRVQRAGAVAVILRASTAQVAEWPSLAALPSGRTEVVGGVNRPSPAALIFVPPDTLAALARFADGQARLSAPRGAPVVRTTYNVIGVRRGSGPEADRQAILLSAHYDHLGVRDGEIFHGANDDASGTAAVMEFARILGRGPAHRRTVYFALFGCEEEGGLGARYFLNHTPVPTSDMAANLEFEMIGVDDPTSPGALMLTGWERSNLGPTLQAHGARIGPDPYPEQHFFQRSDNYQLALQGVVAQTVSAWPVPPTYHAVSDDLAHVDLNFMDQVIGSLVDPIRWLLDSDFLPTWNPNEKP
jgi:hypothetical protein